MANKTWLALLHGFSRTYRYQRTFLNDFPQIATNDCVFEQRLPDGSSKFFAMRHDEDQPHEIFEEEAITFLAGTSSLSDILEKVGFENQSDQPTELPSANEVRLGNVDDL